jgi:type VI secretion system secreted protein Hcp
MHRYNLVIAIIVLLFAAVLVESHSPRPDAPSFLAERYRAVVTAAAGESTLEIYGFSHEVLSPRDAASGLPTGKRQHKPFRILKRVDEASGMLLGSMLTGERIPSVVVTSFTRERGRWVPSRVIRLDDVSVAAVGQNPAASSGNGDTTVTEEVALYYDEISWEYPQSGTEHSDDWDTSES